ncbi:MAG: glutamate synthase-related protein [Kiritimatiellae bacterium]|nr:glutamate synthase-related protein [Kiritimatiellia bacterium]
MNQIQTMPSRFRNPIGKFTVHRAENCAQCGKCAAVCPHGVHAKGGDKMLRPRSHLCAGLACARAADGCVLQCPARALSVEINPVFQALGDYRWTGDLILSTWHQAATGQLPYMEMENDCGASGGGLDRIRILLPEKTSGISPDQVDLRLNLNRRGDGRPEVVIDLPIYGGGMSFGSISQNTMAARARNAEAWNTFTCTGEGGYPEALYPYDRHVITQVATGLFGVREETIQRVRMVEFKYAQGAKPGLGGHLLGDKVTAAVARMRESVAGNALFSPFPFHSVYSIEDHKKHVDWIKHVNPRALVSAKVSTPADVEMVAVGSYYAGAHVIHLDGSYGGTGAAPEIAKKNIAMPIDYAINKTHRFLAQEGIREKIVLIASGGLRTVHDIFKAIALGADGVVIGTAEIVALECLRCKNCESGRGCSRGIASTDPELAALFTADWAFQRLYNLYASFAAQLRGLLAACGLTRVTELTGRTDLLTHLDYQREQK